MILEILHVDERGAVSPLTLCCTQVSVRQSNGTLLAVAAEYGTDRSQLVVKAGDPDFADALRKLGISEETRCEKLILAKPPPNARLVTQP